MRILFVAMANSIHTARWISHISQEGWDLHLFPSFEVGTTHPGLKNITVHHGTYTTPADPTVTVVGKQVSPWLHALRQKLNKKSPDHRVDTLVRLIETLKPDIIHSLEMQGAGYLTLAAKKRLGKKFPRWMVTTWGSDIYYFGRFPAHAPKIKEVLKRCDYFQCECQRDNDLAITFGFKGTIMPVLPAAGGINLDTLDSLRSDVAPNERNTIMLKGYHGWAGRALVGFEALRKSKHVLSGFRVVLYSSQLRSRIASRYFSLITRIPVTIVPHGTPHAEILRMQGEARFSIGLSITDGVPNGMLEAMAMGSLPIQSGTSAASEWIVDGKNGIVVPPEDAEAISRAIVRAATDDALVITASKTNAEIVTKRLDEKKIQPKIAGLYTTILKDK